MAINTYAVGQRLTASLIQSLSDSLEAYIPKTYTKVLSTSRNSTTTYSDDPELAGIALAAGTYDIELVGFFTQATTTTQKIKTKWNFTGTWSSVVRACMGAATDNVDPPSSASDATFCGYVTDTQDATYNTNTGGSYSVFREVARNVAVSASGNLSLQWAQSVSSANNTVLQSGTAFVVRKVL